MKTIIVMNDGETWGGVDGVSILTISEEDHDALCTGEKTPGDVTPIGAEIGLNIFTRKEDQ